MNSSKITEWFLRIAISAGMLSAIADRFGIWPKSVSVWGNWSAFLDYTQLINPWLPAKAIPLIGGLATGLELLLGLLLLVPFKTALVAKATGFLLLAFGLAMAFSLGPKAPLDYSVFCASAAAFALSLIKAEQISPLA
jgi:thiosulfate dehydrogenase (quinone) large subunit